MNYSESFKFNTALLNWALFANKEKGFDSYLTGLKKQKFLFFYNLFAYISDKTYTFEKLKAYKNGPIYQDIFTYAKSEEHEYHGNYITKLTRFQDYSHVINEKIAKISFYLVNSMTNDQVSEITHHFDFWISSFNNSQDKNIYLDNISQKDYDFGKWLLEFWTSMIDEHNFYKGAFNIFYLSNDLYVKPNINNTELTEQVKQITKEKFDYNPVVISLDSKGEIIVD